MQVKQLFFFCFFFFFFSLFRAAGQGTGSSAFSPFFPTRLFHTRRMLQQLFCLVGVLFVFWFMAIPAAYGNSWARGGVRAAAAGPPPGHSHTRSELCLRPTPLLMAMLDP